MAGRALPGRRLSGAPGGWARGSLGPSRHSWGSRPTGGKFSTRPPGPPSASHSIPPAGWRWPRWTGRRSPWGVWDWPYHRQSRGDLRQGRSTPGDQGHLRFVPGQEVADFPGIFLPVPRRSAGLGTTLGVEALEVGRAVVDVGHGGGDGVVAGHLGDGPVHLLGHRTVGRMALGTRAQLDQVHRLPGVHLQHVADAEGQGHRVGGLGGKSRRSRRTGRAERSIDSA